MKKKTRDCLGAQAFGYNGIYVSGDKITQKRAVHLPEDQSVFITQISNYSHSIGCNLEKNQTEIIISGKRPHLPQYSYNIIKRYYPMIYSDIIELNIVGDIKATLMRCNPFTSKKNGIYKSFTILQVKNPKKLFPKHQD